MQKILSYYFTKIRIRHSPLPNAGVSDAPDRVRNPSYAYQLFINLVNSAGSEIMGSLSKLAQQVATQSGPLYFNTGPGM
ncbi:MAG TPA: hypothetical protein VJZ68_00325 [Nitrososphaera sp.]|nr:hypothetical protein [Nitrososphaera sp.]